MKKVIVTKGVVGICHMQVCVEAEATDEEILAACNGENPSGTTAGWCNVERDNPVTCASYPERRHFLVSC